MKKIVIVFVISVFVTLVPERRSFAIPGGSCADDSWCGYGEVCLKSNSWDVLGKCVRGAR